MTSKVYSKVSQSQHYWFLEPDNSLMGARGGDSPVHQRTFSSIPGLSPLGATNTHPLSVVTTKNATGHAKSAWEWGWRWGGKFLTPTGNHWSTGVTTNDCFLLSALQKAGAPGAPANRTRTKTCSLLDTLRSRGFLFSTTWRFGQVPVAWDYGCDPYSFGQKQFSGLQPSNVCPLSYEAIILTYLCGLLFHCPRPLQKTPACPL